MNQPIIYEGKSKIVCRGADDESYIIRYKDTATAFNGEKKEELAGKGKLNAAISNILFEHLAQNGIQTHLIRVLDDTSILVKQSEIILVEVIVRNIAAGGFSKKYGVEEGSPLHNTVTEFSYKSDQLGDPLINDSQITAIGLATQAELDYMKAQALMINDLLAAFFRKRRIILVDFKLEFGRCQGEIILCDEISPDSCRLWDSETNEKLDKDRFRRDLGDVLGGYADVLRRITGQ
ncbi:MAG: phosphoribosylaminoimidazolesuccinocarboxamide synthase [Peptococcaceae bacterium]|jgi:phosphoribosylaminoimidazole-succinocarboxamide synthase|nr:phosphoribosylaminoimidazolesuccinocarboxamide synthase [Peptococcaceae bacterium]